MPFAPPFQAEAYLLRAERKYRYRDGAGRIDIEAARRSAMLLPTAPELSPDQRVRLGRVLDRVEKAVLNFSELAEQGLLDERFGFPIFVEVPEGSVRRGVAPDGTPWEQVFTGGCYGFLPDTVARDAEELDVIGGPDVSAPSVYIVHFVEPGPTVDEPGGKLDEFKLFVGFSGPEAAQACALANWPRERIGQMDAMPLEVLRGLLGYELDEGLVAKALQVATGGGLVVSGPSGLVIGRVEKVRTEPAPEPVRKGAISVATFEGGGLRLPMQGAPRFLRGKICDDMRGKAARCAKAFESACTYRGPSQYAAAPADHPACTWPLTWEYDEPEAVGGWLGAIEPDDESWIAFVDQGGHGLLWAQREADGGVIGEPATLLRPDLAQKKIERKDDGWHVVSTDGTKHLGGPYATEEEALARLRQVEHFVDESRKLFGTVKLCPVEKGLDAATPIDRRIVYGTVLEPEPFEGRGDAHDETYGADVIQRAAYGWLASFANFDDQHGRFLATTEIMPVESFIAPVEFVIGGTVIRKGAWVVAAKIVSDALWARVLSGELNAWSIEGFAERECTTCGARMVLKKQAQGSVWLCPTCDKLALLMP